MVGVWWFVFALPCFFFVREKNRRAVATPGRAVRQGFAELRNTLAEIRRYQPVVWFLAAYWLYIDGVNTVIKMAVDYGLSLGFEASSLDRGAVVDTVRRPSPPRSRSAGSAAGSDRARASSSRWRCMRRQRVTPISSRARATSIVLAVIIGLVQGGVQSLSRSYFGRLVPEGKSSEFFGFYNMMGKFAAVLGPLLTGVVARVTGDSRLSILSILVLFVAGAAMLAVAARAERRAARIGDLLRPVATD